MFTLQLRLVPTRLLGIYGGKSADATLTVTHAVVVSGVAISPAGSSVAAGLSKAYSATASDVYGNTWDVTSSTLGVLALALAVAGAVMFTLQLRLVPTQVTGTYDSAVYTTGLTVNPAVCYSFGGFKWGFSGCWCGFLL